MEKSDREFFIRLYLENKNLSDENKQLLINIFTNAIVSPEQSQLHQDCYCALFHLVAIFNELPDSDHRFMKYSQMVAQIKSLDQFVAMAEKIFNDNNHVTVIKFTSDGEYESQNPVPEAPNRNQTNLLDPEPDELDKHVNVLLPDKDSPKPSISTKHPWLPWVIAGLIIGFTVAAVVIASIASFGLVPASITVGAAIATAVSLTVTSTIAGGFIGAAIKRCKDFFANLNVYLCSRLWCFWVGGFYEVEFYFVKK